MSEVIVVAMFVTLVLFLLTGAPVAFALSAVGLLFGAIGIALGHLTFDLLYALPDRVFGIMRNETLLAIPLFTFMGLLLERSGMAEDLLDTIGQLFGPIRGGLAYAVIFVGAMLAATTGVVAASVISMGLISLPLMMRYRYDIPVACGVIAASGTLAQIIPPSLVLIVLADQMGISVGDVYEGALLPSLVLTGLYALYIFAISIIWPAKVPALPLEARTTRGWQLLGRVIFVLVPPVILIFLVLGTIFFGIATPTEGGAMGAVGALALAAMKRRLNFKMVWQASEGTVKLTTFVIFILVGSTVFGLTFRGIDGDRLVALGRRTHLIYCARSRSDAAFVEDIQALVSDSCDGALSSNFHFDEERGVAPDLVGLLGGFSPETHFYCCGPGPMLEAYESACEKLGYTNVHVERFAAKPALTNQVADPVGYTVELKKSGKTVQVPPGTRLLDALLSAGCKVEFSCREGVCGACETRVISGEVEHRDSILTQKERAANKSMMICVSSCKSGTLVLDA